MTEQNNKWAGYLIQPKSSAKKKQSTMPLWIPFRSWMGKIKTVAKEASLLCFLMLWALVSILILVMTFWIVTLIATISIIVSKKEYPLILNTSTRSLKGDFRKRPLTLLLQVLASASLFLCVMWLLLA